MHAILTIPLLTLPTLLMLTIPMLTLLTLMLPHTPILPPMQLMLLASPLMSLRLRLNPYQKVLARHTNSMDKTVLTIWPLADEIFLYVVFGETVSRDFVVEEGGECGGESEGAGWECAFDLRELAGACAVCVVVYGGLEN